MTPTPSAMATAASFLDAHDPKGRLPATEQHEDQPVSVRLHWRRCLALALDTARAEGRRAGIDEAAVEADSDHTHESPDDCIICAIVADIRALLPTAPAEPEGGDRE